MQKQYPNNIEVWAFDITGDEFYAKMESLDRLDICINNAGVNQPKFIEDVDESLYAFDRMLFHMKAAGMFENIRGLIVGELTEMKDQAIPFGKTTDEIILDICGDLNIPIVTNFPCGHGNYQATLPISLPVELRADKNFVELFFLKSPVRKGD